MPRLMLVLAMLVFSASLVAQEPERDRLTIGDLAPPIDIAHWIKGEPVAEFEEGKIYVIEFWATWCGPCRESMPHLSDLQRKHGEEVKIIGVSDEELTTVVRFLTRREGDQLWYDKIDYTLATDPDRSVMRSYFYAAGQRGIPTAFIIGRDGRVEWIGHPMNMDEPLARVVKGTWDRDAFRDEFERLARLSELADAIFTELGRERREGNWHEVLALLDQAVELDEEQFGHLRNEKARVYIQELKEIDRGMKILRTAAEQQWDNAQALNGIAWGLVDNTGIDDPAVLGFALDVALRASTLTEDRDASILDTVARVYYEMGDLEQAIRWQREAVNHATPGPMASFLQATLDKYESER